MEAENTDYQVVLTPEAAQVVRQTFEEQQVDEATSYLRIGARPGGCSGYKYTMDFSREEELGEGDMVFQSQGIHLVVDKTTMEQVIGSVEVGYKSGTVMERGFTFRPLTSNKICGCGQSFTPIQTH